MRKFVFLIMIATAGASWAGGNPAAGEQKAATCAACHGPSGVSASGAFPTLAGQHEDYLVVALEQYQAGSRKNPVMAAQAVNLSEQDIADLAAYFSKQKHLYTPKLAR